jgi:hypothetical protein
MVHVPTTLTANHSGAVCDVSNVAMIVMTFPIVFAETSFVPPPDVDPAT